MTTSKLDRQTISSRRFGLLAGGALVVLVLMTLWMIFHRDEEPPRDTGAEHPAPAHVSAPRRPWLSRLSGPVAAPLPELTAATHANAADSYRQAFALMDALSEDEKKVLDDWKAPIDPAVAAALCSKLAPIRTLAHQASALTNCDWGIKNNGFGTLLPHLPRARKLARGLIWSAAHCWSNDEPGVGADLEATLRLGYNVSPFLIGHLINTAIERMTMEYITASAGALPRDVTARLMALLSDDAYSESLYRALEAESELARQSADQFAMMSPQERKEFEEKNIGDPIPPGMDAVAAFREMVNLEREYVRALGATDSEYRAFLAKLDAAKDANPLVKVLMPALERVEETTRGTIVQRTMTVAGLALIQDGPNALLSHPDPATGQPFQYRETPTGFELQSAYQLNGKPLVMTFTNRQLPAGVP